MIRDAVDVLTPRILVVDDERQIHASLRLRIGRDSELVFCSTAQDGLAKIAEERFDLCIADLHMPKMDGFAFIEAARKADPDLGYIVLSAFDTEENLRRAIPLQVLAFIGKPLPDRHEFEARIADWVARTRQQRRERELAAHAGSLAEDLVTARIAQEVELVASESARDALLQTTNLLTTIHAHLVAISSQLSTRAKSDPALSHCQRNIDEARKTADAAVSVADGFFGSAYANRDSSPALVNPGIRHAIDIARRNLQTGEQNKIVDFIALDEGVTINGLSGIDFLLMMVPAIGVALASAGADSTIRISGEHLPRLDGILKLPRANEYLWANRRNAVISHSGVMITIVSNGPTLNRIDAEAWLNGDGGPFAAITPRGLSRGVRKSRGLVGISVPPAEKFSLALALPA